jgi:hypothetical protein
MDAFTAADPVVGSLAIVGGIFVFGLALKVKHFINREEEDEEEKCVSVFRNTAAYCLRKAERLP